MQIDPAGMVDGTNMYVYVGNDPVNNVDPSGMGIKGDFFSYGMIAVNNKRLQTSPYQRRSHFWVGCMLARQGYSYNDINNVAIWWEQVENYFRHRKSKNPLNPDFLEAEEEGDQYDISATLWGGYYGSEVHNEWYQRTKCIKYGLVWRWFPPGYVFGCTLYITSKIYTMSCEQVVDKYIDVYRKNGEYLEEDTATSPGVDPGVYQSSGLDLKKSPPVFW